MIRTQHKKNCKDNQVAQWWKDHIKRNLLFILLWVVAGDGLLASTLSPVVLADSDL